MTRQSSPRKPTSIRISDYTAEQMNQLADRIGANNTEIIMLAIDRMYRQEFPERKNPMEHIAQVITE